VEDVFATDIDDLWSAVTDPDRLARWLVVVEGDLRVGGTVQMEFTSTWTGPGRIDVCERPHRLVVTQLPGTEEETVLEAVLTQEEDGCRLVIEERGVPLPMLAGYGAGWQAHLEDLLAHLVGRERGDWRGRWLELGASYERLAAGLEMR
jgi:uncharacterized protein YndB with AHSA1/START domain